MAYRFSRNQPAARATIPPRWTRGASAAEIWRDISLRAAAWKTSIPRQTCSLRGSEFLTALTHGFNVVRQAQPFFLKLREFQVHALQLFPRFRNLASACGLTQLRFKEVFLRV